MVIQTSHFASELSIAPLEHRRKCISELQTEILRAMGSFKAERSRRRGKGIPRTNVGRALAMPANAVGHGRGESGTVAAARAGDDLLHERLFVVRVSDDLEFASLEFPSTKLEDFVAFMQRCAPMLQLVNPDEHIVRVKLVARDGARVREMNHRTLTMGDVQTCMKEFGDLVAVVEKKASPPQASVLSDVTGYPSTTSSASSGHSGDVTHWICAACASMRAQRVPSRRQMSPSSSSASTGSTR